MVNFNCELQPQPVQRVPRYKLLLAELLKHTKETHPDYTNIATALSEVSVCDRWYHVCEVF
jgi:RhoGEF domain